MSLLNQAVVFGTSSKYEPPVNKRNTTVRGAGCSEVFIDKDERDTMMYYTPYDDPNKEDPEAGMTPELQARIDYLDYLLERCDPNNIDRWDYLCSRLLGSEDDINDRNIINNYESKYGREEL